MGKTLGGKKYHGKKVMSEIVMWEKKLGVISQKGESYMGKSLVGKVTWEFFVRNTPNHQKCSTRVFL